MADLTNAQIERAVWPPGVREATWMRLQPLITPEMLRQLYLFGVDLSAQSPDPRTGKREIMSNDLLQLYIEAALERAEMETGLVLMPTEIRERLPLDRHMWEAFMQTYTARRPVWAVREFTLESADGVKMYSFPLRWVEMGNAYRGQLNIVPQTLGFGASTIGANSNATISGPFAQAFLTGVGYHQWVPAFFSLTAEYGFPDSMYPATVNELVGVLAAMDILSSLGASYAKAQGSSLGIDGLSQSVSSPGPNLYATRIEDLQKRKDRLVSKLKTIYGTKFAFGTV